MRRRILAGGYLLAMLLVGFAMSRYVLSHQRRLSPPPTVASLPFATPAPTATPSPAAPPPTIETPTPEPTGPDPLQPSPYGPNRLIIPALGINSSWMGLGFLADGLTMASPPGPHDLGWYAFSGAPGGPSNAIFAGHLDWYTGAPAIFGGLSALGPGSEVQVSRADGMLLTYHVVSAAWYDFLHTDASSIIAPTAVPTVTLITCGGAFNPATHEYDQRLVVRAAAAQ